MNKNYKGRKAGTKDLTFAEMIKIYNLSKKGVDFDTIAATLERDKKTCYRASAIMSLAEQKKKDDLFNFEGDRNSIMKRAAWEYFNGKDEEKPEAADNTLTYLIAMLEESKKQTELLKAMCEAWGVNHE